MKNIDNTGNILHVDKVNYAPFAVLKQEDNFVITLDLYQNGQELDITGQTIELAAKRGDNVVVQQVEGFTLNKNKVTITLKTNVISVPGIVQCELNIKDNTGSFTTSNFSLRVNEKILGETSLNASDNIQALEKVKNEFIASSKALELDFSTNSANELQNFANSSTESLNRFITTSTAQLDNQKTDYESLKKIIIDPNQAANLQNQITETKSQSVENTNRIEELEDLTPVWQEHVGVGSVTIDDSFEGNVKDFIINGQTLQNLATDRLENLDKILYAGQYYFTESLCPVSMLSLDTEYSVVIDANWDKEPSTFKFELGLGNTPKEVYTHPTCQPHYSFLIKKGRNVLKFTVQDFKNLPYLSCRPVRLSTPHTEDINITYSILLLKGDWTNKDIPSYFDGIMSCGESEDNKLIVKSVGKNLVDIDEYFNKIGLDKNDFQTSVIHLKEPFLKCSDSIPSYYVTWQGTKITEGSPNITVKRKNGSVARYINLGEGFVISNLNKDLDFMQLSYGTNCRIKLDTLMVVTDTIASKYEPYVEDKKEILLPIEGGHKGLQTIKNKLDLENGKYTEKVFKRNLASTDTLSDGVIEPSGLYRMLLRIDNMKVNASLMCDTLPVVVYGGSWNNTFECITTTTNSNHVVIYLNATSVADFKSKLDSKNVNILYELATPIIHNIEKIRPVTFDNTTHIIQENSIVRDMNFKAKISLSAQNNRIKSANKDLKIENEKLKEDTSFIAGTLLSILEPMMLPEESEEQNKKSELLNKLLEIKERA